MIKEHPPHSLAAEANDINTTPARLTALSTMAELKPLIAANPATPEATLVALSNEKDAAVRQAVAQNPNTAKHILLNLAWEFPRAFLSNPILQLLNLSDPNFLEALPVETWLHLFRCDNIPLPLLQRLQQSPAWKGQHGVEIKTQLHSQLAFHVAIAGEVEGGYQEAASRALEDAYYQYVPPIDRRLFILFWASSPGPPARWLSELSTMDSEQKAWFVRYHPGITAEFLDELSEGEDLEIHNAIALHPLTPPQALSRLASAAPTETRVAVASHPQASAALLHQLAGDKNQLVRKAVAEHPCTPVDDLARLALDPTRAVRIAVASHAQLTNELTRHLLVDTHAQMRQALARNPTAPQDILMALASDREQEVRQAVAGNPHLPAAAFSALLDEKHENIRVGLASNLQVPVEILLQLANDMSLRVRTEVAANPQMSLPLLEMLIPKGTLPRKGIARNTHVTPTILALLIDDYADMQIRDVVAENMRTPAEVLARLVRHSDSGLSMKVASHPQTSLETLKGLLRNADITLSMRIAEHPTARKNRQIFFEYLMDMMQQYGKWKMHSDLLPLFLKHEGPPWSHLEQFATSLYWQDRYYVALNPATPPAVLADLTRDGNRYVRAAAREAMAKRAERFSDELKA